MHALLDHTLKKHIFTDSLYIYMFVCKCTALFSPHVLRGFAVRAEESVWEGEEEDGVGLPGASSSGEEGRVCFSGEAVWVRVVYSA
jgi:hypothetical protein